MYIRLKEIPLLYPMCITTAVARLDEIEREIRDKRYPATALIRDAKYTAVDEYVRWQSERIGRDIEPGKLIELVMAAGAKRVAVTYPAHTVVGSVNIPVLGTKTVTYGGLEDD